MDMSRDSTPCDERFISTHAMTTDTVQEAPGQSFSEFRKFVANVSDSSPLDPTRVSCIVTG